MSIETTIEQHNQTIDHVRQQAMALPMDAIHAPRMPVHIRIKELQVTLMAAKEHIDALTACGMPVELVDTLAQQLDALDSAQALWQIERHSGRTDETNALITDAEKLRSDALAAGDLALRKNGEGQRRLAKIREGEGLADLVADCRDLSLLLTSGRPLFEAINYDVDGVAGRLGAFADNIQQALAEEDVAKSMSGQKELRDRCLALIDETLGEIRAFAKFAFRNDANPKRQALFFSSHLRLRNRRYKLNKAVDIDIVTD